MVVLIWYADDFFIVGEQRILTLPHIAPIQGAWQKNMKQGCLRDLVKANLANARRRATLSRPWPKQDDRSADKAEARTGEIVAIG